MFLGGFMSDMQGTKAVELEHYCRAAGRAFIRFDYQGHGESSGNFADGPIGSWAEDALAVFDEFTEGSQILVGSSMGGWTMLLTALARPSRVAGMIGIAAAPDFTEDLLLKRLKPDVIERIMDGMELIKWGDCSYPISRKLIEDARDHLLLKGPDGGLDVQCPVRLLHGLEDEEVPYTTAVRLANRIKTEDVTVSLSKSGHDMDDIDDFKRTRLAIQDCLESIFVLDLRSPSSG